MNRRDFIKGSATTAALLGGVRYAVASGDYSIDFFDPLKPHYIIELRVRNFCEGEKLIADEDFDRWSDGESFYVEDFWINDSNSYKSVEDAVSQVFEHCKHFDYKKCEVRYDILYGDEKRGISHAGYYYFFDSNCSSRAYIYEGWHTSNPSHYKDYYKKI